MLEHRQILPSDLYISTCTHADAKKVPTAPLLIATSRTRQEAEYLSEETLTPNQQHHRAFIWMGAKCTSKEEDRKKAAWLWAPKTHRAHSSIVPVAPALQRAGQFPCGTDIRAHYPDRRKYIFKTETLKRAKAGTHHLEFQKASSLFSSIFLSLLYFCFVFILFHLLSLFQVLCYH